VVCNVCYRVLPSTHRTGSTEPCEVTSGWPISLAGLPLSSTTAAVTEPLGGLSEEVSGDSSMSSPALVIVYDLRRAGARKQAHRNRAMWGRLYTDIHTLDSDHIALVFRPAPDASWREWEQVRSGLILGEVAV
jgi:hypothetical protein